MKFLNKITSKLYFKQWTVGVAKEDIKEVIRNKKQVVDFNWLHTQDKMQSYADPFITIDAKTGNVVILAEQFTTGKLNGQIAAITYTESQGFSRSETVLNNGSHLSYPLIFSEKGKQYIIAENAYNTGVVAYEYNTDTNQVVDKIKITSLPLVDATILKKDGKYWLFACMLGKGVFSELHVFFADDFFGPYHSHKRNPVKHNINGARPAGNFIEVDGEIYRPAQNSGEYYGKSITIQKITKLTTTDFEEEVYMQIGAENFCDFNMGIHTINSVQNYLVIDAQKGHFQPVRQLLRFFAKALFSNKKKIGFYGWLINTINAEICNIELAGYFVIENFVFI
jgi:hypothetical protein